MIDAGVELRWTEPPGSLEALRLANDALDSIRPDLAAIRQFNHQTVSDMAAAVPLSGRSLLDVAASYRGYALEAALCAGVREYVGIDLVIEQSVEVRCHGQRGVLRHGDAGALDLPDESVDHVLSISAFEHLRQPERAMVEIARVLRPGGTAWITFEPVWTSPHGHHLPDFPGRDDVVPAWAQLRFTSTALRTHLAGRWPPTAPLSLDEAIHQIFEHPFLNRIPLSRLRRALTSGPLHVRHLAEMPASDPGLRAEAERLSPQLGLPPSTLLCRGLTVLLERSREGTSGARRHAPSVRLGRHGLSASIAGGVVRTLARVCLDEGTADLFDDGWVGPRLRMPLKVPRSARFLLFQGTLVAISGSLVRPCLSARLDDEPEQRRTLHSPGDFTWRLRLPENHGRRVRLALDADAWLVPHDLLDNDDNRRLAFRFRGLEFER